MLTKESTEKLFKFLLSNAEKNKTDSHTFYEAMDILEELDSDIQDYVEEFNDLKIERDNQENEIEDLERQNERLQTINSIN